jgi:hypothetical protein
MTLTSGGYHRSSMITELSCAREIANSKHLSLVTENEVLLFLRGKAKCSLTRSPRTTSPIQSLSANTSYGRSRRWKRLMPDRSRSMLGLVVPVRRTRSDIDANSNSARASTMDHLRSGWRAVSMLPRRIRFWLSGDHQQWSARAGSKQALLLLGPPSPYRDAHLTGFCRL